MRISSPATAKEDSTRDFSLAASPSSVENGFVFSNRFFSENRVWGSAFENRTLTGASTWLSSTTRPGCGYRCGGIASVSTVQRYYVGAYGRFNTADPYQASAKPGNPGSWNRYNYALGDPLNRSDPRGLRDDSVPCVDDGDDCGGYAGMDPCFQIGIVLAWGNYNCNSPVPVVPIQPPSSPVPPSCDISVSTTALIGNNNLAFGANPPPDDQLGPYQAANGGVYLAVQVQGILNGVTNPLSWSIGQAAAAVTVSGTPLSANNGVASNNPDLPNPVFIYNIPGGTGWTDTPGVGNVIGDYKFFFTSSLTLNGTDVSCDVQWGFEVTNNGNTWSVAPWGTNTPN